jgi:hypothetical protein
MVGSPWYTFPGYFFMHSGRTLCHRDFIADVSMQAMQAVDFSLRNASTSW